MLAAPPVEDAQLNSPSTWDMARLISQQYKNKESTNLWSNTPLRTLEPENEFHLDLLGTEKPGGG